MYNRDEIISALSKTWVLLKSDLFGGFQHNFMSSDSIHFNGIKLMDMIFLESTNHMGVSQSLKSCSVILRSFWRIMIYEYPSLYFNPFTYLSLVYCFVDDSMFGDFSYTHGNAQTYVSLV